MKKAITLVEAETNLIRKMLEQNLGCSHEEIMPKLNISRPTYHRHINRIYKEDAKIWDKVHIDSAKYRATKLIQSLDECIDLCIEIRDNPKNRPDDRMEASRTMSFF